MPDWLKPVTDFLVTDEGRWATIGIVSTVVFLLILSSVLRRWQRQLHLHDNKELLEELATYPPAPPLGSKAQPLTLYGLPVRIRLIVLGPLGKDAGQIHQRDIEGILERMVPGLKDRVQADLPRIRLWPTQLSHTGFVAAFRRNTQLPEGEDRIKRWVLVMGKVIREGSPIAVGLALQSTEDNTLGPVVLQHAYQWMEVMRFAKS